MADTGDVRIVLTVDSTGAVKSVENFDKAIEGLVRQSPSAGGAIGNLWKQMAVGDLVARGAAQGLSFLGRQLGSVVEAAIEGEKADRALAASLEITGRRVPGMAESLGEYASQLQSMTIYDDEAIKSVEALLAQMTNLDEKGLKQATRGAIGLASVFSMDLQSAGNLVQKALGGNTAALSRYGIRIDDTLPKQQKQAELLKRLEEMFKRSTAETNTGAGSLALLKNNLDDAKERLGNVFLPVISEGARKIALLAEKIAGLKRELDENGAEAKKAAAINEIYADSFYLTTAKAGLTQKQVVTLAQAHNYNYKAIMDEVSAGRGSIALQKEWQKELPKTEERVKKLTDSWNDLEQGNGGAGKDFDDLKKSLDLKDTGDIQKRIANIKTALASLSLDPATRAKLTAEMNKLGDELAGALDGALRKMSRGEKGKAAVAIPIAVEFVGNAPTGFLTEVTEELKETELPTTNLTDGFKRMMAAMRPMVTIPLPDRIKKIKEDMRALGPITADNVDEWKKLNDQLEKAQGNFGNIKTEETVKMVVAAVNQIASSISGVSNAITAGEEIRVENWYKKRLEYINKTISSETKKEKAIAALEAEYEIKKTSAKRKAAVIDKALSITDALVNTAVAYTAQLRVPVIGPALAKAVAILGAIQVAFIAAQPIPLAKGGLFSERTVLPTGYEVAEAGSREIVSPEPLMRQIVRQESRANNSSVNFHLNFTINALDGASVQQTVKTTIIPMLQEALDRRVLKVAHA